VVQVGSYSTEFCGGTHTSASGQVGPLIIVSEGSIGSNLRRVEALTGMAAYDHLVSMRSTLDRTGDLLRTTPDQVPQRVTQLLDKVSGLETQLERIATQRRGSLAEELAAGHSTVGEVSLVVADAGDVVGPELRQVALGVRDRVGGPSVIVLGSTGDGKGSLVAVVTKDLQAKGVSAGDLIAEAAHELGGGGSRDPELAQAGGPNGSGLSDALDTARAEAERALAGL
jgi:alanyl-tRNA synthetase